MSISIVLIGHFALPASGAGIAAVGVVVFFFLSGFLITRLLFLEHRRYGHIRLSGFYARRIVRLYPALVLYLAVVSTVQWRRTGGTSLLEIGAALGNFSNYLISWRHLHGTPFLLPIGGFWSLAIEEHFYVLMPLAALHLRMRPELLLRTALFTCAACALARAAELLIWPQIAGTLVLYRHSETRFDAVAMGVLMAAMAELAGGRRTLERLSTPGWFAGGCGVFCASYLVRQDFMREVLCYSLQQIALLPIVCGILFGRLDSLQSVLNLAGLRLLGRLSYSLYIWQGGAKFLVAGSAGNMPWLESPLPLLAVTLVTASASYYLVERPLMGLRKRLWPPRDILL